MSQSPVTRSFDNDTTIRWSARAGEYVLWVATSSVLAADRESSWTIADFWQMRDGDFVTITNRWLDLPGWFTLHPLEVANRAAYEMMKRLEQGYKPTEPMDGPHIWRVKAGDRLVWVTTSGFNPVKEILDLRSCALALGENSALSWDRMALFGAPEGSASPPPVASAMRAGFNAAVALGVPRVFSEDWRFGAWPVQAFARH